MEFYEKNRSTGLYLFKEYNENLNFGRHMHRSFEFIHVLGGVLTLNLYGSDAKYEIMPGKAAMIMPYQVHSYYTETESRYIMAIFSGGYVRAFNDMVDSGSRIAESPVFDFDDEKLSRELLATDDGDLLMLKAYLYAICAAFNRQSVFRERSGSDANLLDLMINYVETHFKENITLRQIAEKYNYNYQYLSNFFNTRLGMNFKRFLNECRIQEACVLLRENGCNITEAAYQSGYDTLRSFNREFVNITGVTPSEYRRGGAPRIQ